MWVSKWSARGKPRRRAQTWVGYHHDTRPSLYMKKQSEGGFRFTRSQYRNFYLKSEWWASKRDKINDRDPVCRICDTNPTAEVHHLSYARLFREHDSDLIGVCHFCHTEIHKCPVLRRQKCPAAIKILIKLTKSERLRLSPPSPPVAEPQKKRFQLPWPGFGITAFAKPESRFKNQARIERKKRDKKRRQRLKNRRLYRPRRPTSRSHTAQTCGSVSANLTGGTIL